MVTITKFLSNLYKFPDRIIEPEEDREPFLTHWGFTVYRTCYSPGSDGQWSRLLKNISDGVEEGLAKLDGADKAPNATAKAKDQFLLDVRSDPATLDSATLEDIRQRYLEGSGGQPMNTDTGLWLYSLFLLADAQVLQDPDLRFLKVFAANYDPVAAVPKNRRFGPQRYFGWMTIPTTAVLDMYNELDIFEFEQLVSHAGGGPGAFWDPWEQC